MFERECSLDQTSYACGCIEVSEVALNCSDSTTVPAAFEDFRKGRNFDRITNLSSSAVSLDVS